MIGGEQMRAGRALLGIDQRALAALCGLSLPTIQRMEASQGSVRAVVGSLEKVLTAFAAAGVEMIFDGAPSSGLGRGVRLIERTHQRRKSYVARLETLCTQDGNGASAGVQTR